MEGPHNVREKELNTIVLFENVANFKKNLFLKLIVTFADQQISSTPFRVHVEPSQFDRGQVIADGPGLEQGNSVGKPTYFDVRVSGQLPTAGPLVDVVILDPNGNNTLQPTVKQLSNGVFRCEYLPHQAGLHSINVFFAGQAIAKSPFGVHISPG